MQTYDTAPTPTPDFLEREIEKLKDAIREIQATLGFDHLIGEPETVDEQTLKRFDEREQFDDDDGEPTPDDWECWLAEGTAAFRSLAQERDEKSSAPQGQGEVKWIRT